MKRVMILSALVLSVLFSSFVHLEVSSAEEWQQISTWHGMIYNGTIATSISYSEGFDGQTLRFPMLTADNQYHYVAWFNPLITANQILYNFGFCYCYSI